MANSREEWLHSAKPHLIADVTLYTTEEGGTKLAAQPGYRCPCCGSGTAPVDARDGRLIHDGPLRPGESRRSGFVFLSGEKAASVFQMAETFYLWEGQLARKAVLVQQDRSGE
jgi:hypothetical protein